MNDKKETYGAIEFEDGSKLDIVDFVQASFKDNRTVTISSIERGTILIALENLKSSNRNIQQKMHLTEESFFGVLFAMFQYCNLKRIDIDSQIEAAAVNKQISFGVSPNLNIIEKEDSSAEEIL